MSEQTNVKTYPVITISREYGAGGRTVAKGLAEKLGIPWYDKDFVKEAAKESGYSVEDIEREGEELSHASRIMNSILNNAVSYTSSHDGIFRAQIAEVLKLSASPCIIVGRCSNLILRDAGVPSFDIFLYSDLEHRMQRAAELAENDGMDLKKYIAKRDTLRETYYQNYTHHELGDYHDYDVSINTGKIGMQATIELLASMIQSAQ